MLTCPDRCTLDISTVTLLNKPCWNGVAIDKMFWETVYARVLLHAIQSNPGGWPNCGSAPGVCPIQSSVWMVRSAGCVMPISNPSSSDIVWEPCLGSGRCEDLMSICWDYDFNPPRLKLSNTQVSVSQCEVEISSAPPVSVIVLNLPLVGAWVGPCMLSCHDSYP